MDPKSAGTVLILDGCPMNSAHGRNGDTAVVLRTDGKIGFECKHNGCQAFEWKHVRAQIDPAYVEMPTATASWEPPIPLCQPVVEPFETDMFPEELCAMCAMCNEVAESYQVPIDLVATLCLAIGSAALAKRVVVHVDGDHFEPVNLYVAVALEPGNRKSSVFRAVSEPLREFEEMECARLKDEVSRNQAQRRVLQASLNHAEKAAAGAKDAATKANAMLDVERIRAELLALPELVAPQYIGDDATPEAVSRLLAEQHGRFALLSPEGDVFDLIAGRYDPKGRGNLGVYLKGHAGDDIRVNRVTRGREYVHKPALTVGLTVQPEVIRGLAQRPGFRGRGLIARFMFVIPRSPLGSRRVRTKPVTAATVQGWRSLIWDALQLQPVEADQSPLVLKLAAQSRDELFRFARTVETELGPSGKLTSFKDWGGKLVGLVARIAGILHGLRYAKTGRPDEILIDHETMLCAISIGEYAVAHASAAFVLMGADAATCLAERLLRWMDDEQPTEFTRREAYIRLRGCGLVHRTVEVDPALQLLEEHGFIHDRERHRGGPGRQPSRLFDVNPLTYTRNAQIAHNSTPGDCAQNARCAQEASA